ncbi:MAG: release factor glutamine methyltransferase, partial [Solirubrobacteraceae bacterium]|nr:release factor glutamine methyltransferase [Solirubrobacteraceae bacterium]
MTLREAVERLAAAGVETPQLDAEVLLAHALGTTRTDVIVHRPRPPATFPPLVERRAAREPVAYITGSKGFRRLELRIDRR